MNMTINDDRPVSFMTPARTRALIRERDEAKDEVACLRRQLRDAEQDADMSRAEMEADTPRPLTADPHAIGRILDVFVEAGWVDENDTDSPDVTDVARDVITAVLNPTPKRPEWIDAPAVRAWHKGDGRTEHDGTPAVKRVWSPDYKTTETWSTPSLRNVHWSRLVDVEPLDVTGGGS